jgi:hypothetical protein
MGVEMRKRKSAGVVSQFLKQQYGIGWRDISSKLRASLLEELEHVPCNLCGRDDSQPVASRDKYRLPLTTVICQGCGLIYLNPRPTAATYKKFYEEGGQRDSIYHRRIDFSAVDDLLKFYYGSEFVMSAEARTAMAKFMAEQGIGRNCEPLEQATGEEGADPEAFREQPAAREDEEESEDGSALGLKAGKIDYYAKHIYDELKDIVPVGGKVFEPGASWGKMLQPL